MIRRLAAGALALVLGAGALIGGVTQTAAAADEAQVSLEPVVYGEPLVLTGTGWVDNAGTAGSVMSVLLDASKSGDPNTVYTKLEVVDPTTGAVSADKRLHALIQAEDDGSWRVEIPYPTATNSSAGDTSPAWEVGTSHQIRVLSGSLGVNDQARSIFVDFTVYAELPTEPTPEPSPDPDPEPEPDPDAPEWAHVRIETGDGAVAWVSSDVSAGDSSTLRIRGRNWTTTEGTGASTVALKLNNSADGGQHTHTGSDIIQHPSASGDATIWSLLAPSNPSNHPYVVPIDADGSFDIEVPAPTGLHAGDYLSVLFQSGRFDAADVQRTATTPLITVGGVPYDDEGGSSGDQPTCYTEAYPSIEIVSETVPLGGQLHVRGEGWCHPEENSGGSVVAFKIDEGGFSHLPENAVHQNLTIWALIEADPEDGTFDSYIELPDGTDATSSPAFTMGAHTLRLLTGSMKPGDQVRTLKSEEFVVGEYQPLGTPDPLDVTALTSGNTGKISLDRSASEWLVTIPGAVAGDWVYPNLYAGASQRAPWGAEWFRADAQGRVTLPIDGIVLPTGPLKFTLQSGNQGERGELLGWLNVTIDAPQANEQTPPAVQQTATTNTNTASNTGPTTGSAAGPSTGGAAATTGSQVRPLPTFNPEAPVKRSNELRSKNPGNVTLKTEDGVAQITVPNGVAGTYVYLYIYPGQIPVGWVLLDENQSLTLEVSALPPGAYRVSLQDEAGDFLGWAAMKVDGDVPVTEFAALSPSVDGTVTLAEPAAEGGISGWQPSNVDFILVALGVLLLGGTAATVLAVAQPASRKEN